MAVTIGYGGTPPFYVTLNGTASLGVTTTVSGSILANTSNPQVCTVSPASASGPSATFTLTGFGLGTCTLTFIDAKGEQATLAVQVIGPLTLADITPGGPGTQPYAVIQAAEPNFTGLLTPACVPQANGSISGPGTIVFAGTGPSQLAPGPVQWIVTPASGITSLTIDLFDEVGNTTTLAVSFVPSVALPPFFTVQFIDFSGLNNLAAGFAWNISLAGLPEGTSIPAVDSGYTQVGGTIQSALLLAETYYTITFEGNGAPPTPVTFLTPGSGTPQQTVQILDYVPPMRGISDAGYTDELLNQYVRNWFSDTARAPGGNAYAVTYAFAGPLAATDTQAEILRLTAREQTSSGADLKAWANDFFGYVTPLPKIPGESSPSYRNRIVSMLSGKVSTLANMQSVFQTYENAVGQGAQVTVFDLRSNPGGAAQIPGVVTGVFVVLIDFPLTVPADCLFADFGFANFAYAGTVRNTDFFLDNDFLDWNYLLPAQNTIAPMPIWDSILNGIVKSRKSAGRVPILAQFYD